MSLITFFISITTSPITLFGSKTMFYETHNLCEYFTIQVVHGEYSVEYYRSHITLFWI